MEEFRNQIIKLFQENPLPLEAKYYVLKDVFRDVNEGYYNQLEAIKKEKEVKDDAESVQQTELS